MPRLGNKHYSYSPRGIAQYKRDKKKAATVNERKKKNWLQGAVNPEHEGYCTPMTKATCTPRRKAFAETMKKHHGFHEDTTNDIYYRTFDLLGENKKKKKKGAVKTTPAPQPDDPGGKTGAAEDAVYGGAGPAPTPEEGPDQRPLTAADKAKDKEADTPMRGMKVAAKADPEGAKKLVGKKPMSAADKENLLVKVAQHKAAKIRAKRKKEATKQGTLRGEPLYKTKRAAETIYRGIVQGLGGGSESHHVGDARRERNENMTNDVYGRMLILMEDDLDEAANIARGLGYITPKFLRPKSVRVRSALGHQFPSQHPGLVDTGHPGTTDRSTGAKTAPVPGRTGTAEPGDTMVRPNAPSSRSRTHVNLQDVANRDFDDSSLPKHFQRKSRQSANQGGSFMDQFRSGLINRASSDAAKRRVATKSSVKRRVSGPEGSKGPYGSKGGSRLSAQRSTASPEATGGFAAAQKAKRAEARDARRAARHPNRAKLQRSTNAEPVNPTTVTPGPGRIERGTGLNPEQQKAFATSFQGATELAAKDRKPSHSAGGNGGSKPKTPDSGGGDSNTLQIAANQPLTGDGTRKEPDSPGVSSEKKRQKAGSSKIAGVATSIVKGVARGRKPAHGGYVGLPTKESTSYLRMAKLLETVTISTAGTGARTISGKEKLRGLITQRTKRAPQKQLGSIAGGNEYGTKV